LTRRGRWSLGCALTCGLVATLLPVRTAGAAVPPSAERSAAAPETVALDVPTLLSGSALRARLPSGKTVTYQLPSLPDGGARVLGDWDDDGVETAGIFDDGQWKLSNQVERANSPLVTATFGEAGDVPVTGDWNGDGITDLGVVRGSEWLLALGPVTDGSSPNVWRDLTFGDGTGTPVAGDWDGNGRDGIGTFHDGTWVLASSLEHLTATTTAAYGAVGDLPVVGDWDGDGTDGIGTVRGSTWHLSNEAVDPLTVRWPTFAPVAGEIPVGWQVRTVRGATSCPTARQGRSGRASWVVPSTLLDADVKSHVGSTGRAVRRSLENAERYLLGAQYDAKWKATRKRAYLDLVSGSHDELDIRLPAMSALTVAIGLRTGAYDRAVVRRSRAGAVRYVDQLVRSVACSHLSVSPGGWGRGWQTAHWAMLAGAAAWLVWGHLTPETQTDVASMVVDEADRRTHQSVGYWSLADGTVLTPGDTKAEEDGWNSSLLSFADAMMPDAPQAAAWRATSAELAVAAFSVRADDTSSSVVNGVRLSSRLRGFNAYPDGTVENHQRIHPDYAGNIQLLWTSADFDRLAHRRVPEAMFHNAGLVYSAFSKVSYAAGAPSPAGGTFVAPGGTVYVPGHSWIYYPQGDDWGTARRAHFVSLDAHATTYAAYLRAKGWASDRALHWHERGQQNLVASSGTTDGRTYSVDPAVAAQQDTYPGREEYAAQNLATAWLALYIGRIGVPKLDRGTLPVPAVTSKAPKAPATQRLAP
jgi:hypothetical protein